MPPGRTEEALDIVWTDDEGQNFREGVNAYAFFADPNRQSPTFPVGAWLVGTLFQPQRLTNENWVVLMWTILPGSWPEPDRLCPTLERTLESLSDGAAVVAWCALEGSFEVPPQLFDPNTTYDRVYAMMVPGHFACSARLRRTYEPLSKDELMEFMRLTSQRFAV